MTNADEEFVNSVLAGIPVPVILVDGGERILRVNPAACAIFGERLEGAHFYTVVRQPEVLDCLAGVIETGQAMTTKYHGRDHGQTVIYRVRCAPVDRGDRRGALVSFEDITPLEAASQMRRDFVANVSHELRSPLTAIMGFIETLRGSARNDPHARERFLQTMEKEAGRMNRLVNDLLSLSRLESEERVRPTGCVDLGETVEAVCRSLRPVGESLGVAIELELAEGAGWKVAGDQDQLVQVFTNLAENALKYGGDGGRVLITGESVARDPVLRVPAYRIDVRDFGSGIESQHIHRLTERFYRADNHRSRELGGTGLGLAIVKHIVNRHRGRLKIESEPGKGSCFTVMLPKGAG